MPVVLFTWQAYGTWMPDDERGYVRRDRDGVQPPDVEMARFYRRWMNQDAVWFAEHHREKLLAAARDCAGPLTASIYGVAMDPTHLHVLTGWRDERDWKRLRRSLRHSLSRTMNTAFEKREWFSDGGSSKSISGETHFDYLPTEYLPGHHALFWSFRDASR